MEEEKKAGLTPEQQEAQQAQTTPTPRYTPASRGKRLAAWIGVILMVGLVIFYSYSLATGAFLNW